MNPTIKRKKPRAMKTAAKKKGLSTKDKIRAQQRALEAGKAGYKQADTYLDELQEELKVDVPVDIGNGEYGILRDKFAGKTRIGAGLSVRRYEIEITRAQDVAETLRK